MDWDRLVVDYTAHLGDIVAVLVDAVEQVLVAAVDQRLEVQNTAIAARALAHSVVVVLVAVDEGAVGIGRTVAAAGRTEDIAVEGFAAVEMVLQLKRTVIEAVVVG